MSVPAVLVRKSTKQIIKEAVYPNADMSPVVGLDPDYEWLIKHVPFAEPDYDSRLYIMQMVLPDMTALDSFTEHPSYAGIREYRITYNPNKRPDAEIIVSIENAEKAANNGIVSEATHKDEFVFMLSSVEKKSSGLTLNATEQEPITLLQVINVKLAKNKDNAAIKIAQVIAGNEPNIDLGWESSL